MAAIVDCTNALKNMGATVGPAQLTQLNHLVDLTEQAAKRDPGAFTKALSPGAPLPRVHSEKVDQAHKRVTRSMTDQTQSVPRVSTAPPPTAIPHNNPQLDPLPLRRKKRKKAPPVSVDAPVRNTRSHARATARRLTPPAASTRARTGASTRSSRLRQSSTARKAKPRTGHAADVEVRLSQCRL